MPVPEAAECDSFQTTHTPSQLNLFLRQSGKPNTKTTYMHFNLGLTGAQDI